MYHINTCHSHTLLIQSNQSPPPTYPLFIHIHVTVRTICTWIGLVPKKLRRRKERIDYVSSHDITSRIFEKEDGVGGTRGIGQCGCRSESVSGSSHVTTRFVIKGPVNLLPFSILRMADIFICIPQ